MTQRQAVEAARKRSLINGDEAQAAAPTRHRRHCPACGNTFLPLSVGHMGFCCACCAEAWGNLREKGTLDRRIAKGVEVLIMDTGEIGVVESVTSETLALVRIGRTEAALGPKDIERMQYLDVKHFNDCGRGKNPFARTTSNPEAETPPAE